MIIHRPRDAGDAFYRPSASDYSHAYISILRSARNGGAYHASAAASSSSAQYLSSISASSAASAVLILVKPDVDGLAASRALAWLLREDDIAHRVVPVDGYATLNRVIKDDVEGNDALHTIVLLNLGSLLSLPNFFTPTDDVDPDDDDAASEQMRLPPRCTVHLIDSHRPYNLDNLFATSELNERVWVWDDGEIQERLAESEGRAYEALEFHADEDDSEEDDNDDDDDDGGSDSPASGSEEDDDDDEDGLLPSDDEDDNDGHQRRRKRRRRRSRSESLGDNDGAGESGDEAGSQALRRRRRRKGRNAKRPDKMSAAALAQHRAILNRYYGRGTGYGLSVAVMMHLLAEKLGRAQNETLWLAILGLTSQYLFSALPHDTYDTMSKVLANDVRSRNAQIVDGASREVGVEGLSARPDQADDGGIRVVEKELRFILYRHWSLESAMYHTPYVAGKLELWREHGVAKLRGLLAKMGFSLAQCRQSFDHMDLDLQRALVGRIESIAPEYGLTECVFRSFLRSFGFQSSALSAADAVEGLSALLCAAHGVRIEVDTPGLTFAGAGVGFGGGFMGGGGSAAASSELFGARRLWNLGGGSGVGAKAWARASGGGDVGRAHGGQADKENRPPAGERTAAAGEDDELTKDEAALEAAAAVEEQQQTWAKNFFTAFHALDSRKASSIALLRSSLSLSKALHRCIVAQGVALIDKQAIRFLKSFRLAVLNEGPELSLLASQPALLTRLALWLVDALRDMVVGADERRVETQRRRRREAKRKNRKRLSLRKRRAGGGEEGEGAQRHEDEEEEEEEDDDDDETLRAPPSMPFVLAALDETRDRYLVVGVNGARDFGDVRRNRFGLAFQEAAQRSSARTRHDRFETSAIDVRREDLGEFISTLHLRA